MKKKPALVNCDWVRAFLKAEEIYPRSIWEDLGFWKSLLMTLHMVFRPYTSARVTSQALIDSLLQRLRSEMLLFREDDSSPSSDYVSIHNWWRKRFDRSFKTDWIAARETEELQGDCVIRILVVEAVPYSVTLSLGGFTVGFAEEKSVQA